jgi:hypothetical protein
MSMSGSGVEKNALNNSAFAATQGNNALGTINPIYSRMATGNDGFTPQQKANMLTASAQSIGGANAGAVGQGGLYEARTGNAGGAAAAIDDSARAAMEKGSENALDIENKDAALRTSNQRVGLEGLNSIYDDSNRTAEGYLNTANSAAQARAQRRMGYFDIGASLLGANKKFQGIGS